MPTRVLGVLFSLLLAALPTFAADRNIQAVGILHLGGEQIEVLSWSWGMTQTASSTGGGGGGAGKVQMQDFHFTKPVDKASLMLFDACMKGQHFPEATLTVRKAGGGQQEYMTFKMTDVLVSSYQTGGSTSDIVNESFSFNFSRIELMVPRGR